MTMLKATESNGRMNTFRKWVALATGLCAFCLAPFLYAAEAKVNLLAFGDWGAESPAEAAVASGMKTYLERSRFKPDAVLLLGDNFYVKLPGGVNDPRWQKMFEQMYDSNYLAAPFYAALGNEDYKDGAAQVELDYARQNPHSRFKMPAHWYRADLPPGHPRVTLIALDSNADQLGEEQWAAQTRWLEAELAKPRTASWTICFAHHPLFSNSTHGDNRRLQNDWGPLFKKYTVDFYLAGHDHCLEYLQIPGRATSFVVSGGGGYDLYPIKRRDDRAPFARSEHGFVRLEFDAEIARVTYLDETGKTLYAFERNRQGEVKAVPTTP